MVTLKLLGHVNGAASSIATAGRHPLEPGFRYPLLRPSPRSRLDSDADGRSSRCYEWATLHHVELIGTPIAACHLNPIECHFQPVCEFLLNASGHASHADMATALRRYLHRRNADPSDQPHPRFLESVVRVA